MKSVAVITPTIGKKTLWQCVKSVSDQTYKNINHHIIVDGCEYAQKVHDILWKHDPDYHLNDYTMTIKNNVGKNGFYGHRVYAAWCFLCNEDYIMFLDEDNWLEPKHVEACINTIETKNLDWCFSYRNIHEENGDFICPDLFESRGKFHIDTSCFFLKREVAAKIGHAWYGGWGQDRVFFSVLRSHFSQYDTTNCYSLNYRLGGNAGSVTKEFFLEGNAKIQ